MTVRDTNPYAANAATRQLTCAQCGDAFGCSLDGNCWCAHEPVRLPMPAEGSVSGSDCLCPRCLREAARLHHTAAQQT